MELNSDPRAGATAPDWKEVLAFVQQQAANDRSYFDSLYKRTAAFASVVLAILLGIVGFIGLRTQSDVRNLAAQETERMRGEVRDRIEEEFRQDRIQKTVREVAAERTAQELQHTIQSEISEQVGRAVTSQQETIRRAVVSQTEAAVKAMTPIISSEVKKATEQQVSLSVRPVQEKLKQYGDQVQVQSLAVRATSGDRKAFDLLTALWLAKADSDPETAGFCETAVKGIINAYRNQLHGYVTLNGPRQPDRALLALLGGKDSDPMERTGAIDMLTEPGRAPEAAIRKDLIQSLVHVIETDPTLEVVYCAIRGLDQLTGQASQFPEVAKVLDWWRIHQGEYQ